MTPEEEMARSFVEEYDYEQVAKGATMLDEECPDWADNIHLMYFDIGSGRDCVLGQVFGDYGTGLRELEYSKGESPDTLNGAEFGFDCSFYASSLSTGRDHAGVFWPSFKGLQAAWVIQILMRQKRPEFHAAEAALSLYRFSDDEINEMLNQVEQQVEKHATK